MEASQSWGLVKQAIQEQVQQVYYRMAQERDMVEVQRLQGEIRALNWVLGVPAELGRNVNSVRRGS